MPELLQPVGADSSGAKFVDHQCGKSAVYPVNRRPNLPVSKGRQLFGNRLPFPQTFPWSNTEVARDQRTTVVRGDGPSGGRPNNLGRSVSPETPVSCTPLLPRRLLNSSLVVRIRGRSLDSAGSGDRSPSFGRQKRVVEQSKVSSLEKEVLALLRRRRRGVGQRQKQPNGQRPSPSTAGRGTPPLDQNSSDIGSRGSTTSSPIAHN